MFIYIYIYYNIIINFRIYICIYIYTYIEIYYMWREIYTYTTAGIECSAKSLSICVLDPVDLWRLAVIIILQVGCSTYHSLQVVQ